MIDTEKHESSSRSFEMRIVATILLVVGWLSFIILYLAFAPTGYSLFQNIAVIPASLLLVGGVIGSLWVHWGFTSMGATDDK